MTYDFDIVYKRGTENRAADALLRMSGHELACMTLSSILTTLYQQVLESYDRDASLQRLLLELQQNPKSH